MGNDNGNVRNILPSLDIMYFESFYFIISFYFYFVNHFLWHNFYTWLYLIRRLHDVVCSFEKEKKCWSLNFLFRDGVDVVAYLSMDNHKTRKI